MTKINIPEVIWKEIGKDDYCFDYKLYTLRVEKLDKQCWWWNVYYKSQIPYTTEDCKTQKEAMLSAELAFVKHLITN